MAAESGFWAGENIEYSARTCVQVCVVCVQVCVVCMCVHFAYLRKVLVFLPWVLHVRPMRREGGEERSKQYCMFSYGIQATSLSTHQC